MSAFIVLLGVSLLIISSIEDINGRRVSSWLVVLLLGVSFVSALTAKRVDGSDWHWQQLLLVVFWFLLLLPGFLLRVMGAADIKIILILALISPFTLLLHALVLAFGGVVLWWLIKDRDRREYPFIPFLTLGFGVSLWMHGVVA
ncbi:hypothetical protein C7H85_04980 [Zobellella endophytica]|uniref:Prepilin type IV endopeptidase peptidase domain-containing protein n=1 Tax=Zobellella endophytica TaxID=2116700 RepID=A0A2P7RD89_9GAMM|nr:prepilin peptidase [Zobellella endophytica]PSJ48140.1 hypothetical protein C7H85_04980 [Zobellella endophytica]